MDCPILLKCGPGQDAGSFIVIKNLQRDPTQTERVFLLVWKAVSVHCMGLIPAMHSNDSPQVHAVYKY